jgi:Cu+-exporting ATPase
MDASALASLLWFIGVGALAYFVMRAGGCGAHGHGRHGSHEGDAHAGHDARPHEPATSTAARPGVTPRGTDAPPVDPVCGMPVANPSPALERSYRGRTFVFCSQDCMRKFDADPPSYARPQPTTAPHRHAHGC